MKPLVINGFPCAGGHLERKQERRAPRRPHPASLLVLEWKALEDRGLFQKKKRKETLESF